MQNFRQIFVLSYLYNILLIMLLLVFLLQLHGHREKETEQNLTKVHMISQDESFIDQLRAMMALMQEVLDKRCNQLQNEIESLKELMKVKETHIDELQNMADSVKTIKMGDLAELQNQMGLIQKAMEAKNKRFAQPREDM